MSRPIPYAAHHAQMPGMFMGRMGPPIRRGLAHAVSEGTKRVAGMGDANAAQVVNAASPGIQITAAAAGAAGAGLVGGLLGMLAGHPGIGVAAGVVAGGVGGYLVGGSMANVAQTTAAQAPPSTSPTGMSPTGTG